MRRIVTLHKIELVTLDLEDLKKQHIILWSKEMQEEMRNKLIDMYHNYI